MKITFYTPSCGVADAFGAATFGFAGAEDERLATSKTFPLDVRGDLLTGSYEECLEQIQDKPYQAGIVLLGNAGGENAFVRELSRRLCIPLTGGGAAIDPVTGESGLIFGRGQATVLLLCDERYDFSVYSENIHQDILSQHTVLFDNPRVISQIDGQEPGAWLRSRKSELGLSADDFEHLTLTDSLGVNAHLSCVEEKICSGRDLQPTMYLRYLASEQVYERMQQFYDDPDAIVFGCAGLKGILPEKLRARSMGLFLFGEVCTMEGQSEFGNLMLSKLRIRPKA